MLIGLGGGAASSMQTGANIEDLDFDSVQRGNAEIERRAQEVIDYCWQMERRGGVNPILSIHDVGAGGLSNALPELLHGAGQGGVFNLRDIPSEERGMSPMQIWSNEAQERYVLAIMPQSLELMTGGYMAHPSSEHDGFVISAHLAGYDLLESPEIACQIGSSKFIVECRGAYRAFEHDLEG